MESDGCDRGAIFGQWGPILVNEVIRLWAQWVFSIKQVIYRGGPINIREVQLRWSILVNGAKIEKLKKS